MIQVNRIYLIFNRLVTKKFLVDTSVPVIIIIQKVIMAIQPIMIEPLELKTVRTRSR